jgi:hypothetical protein
MFSVPDGDRSLWQIILWWERRCVPYNFILLAVGICSVFFFYFFTANEPIKNGGDTGEPIMLLIAPFIINACYTFGWIVEAFAPKAYLESFPGDPRKIGPRFLRMGIQLSLALILLPTIVWAGLWLFRIVGLRHQVGP